MQTRNDALISGPVFAAAMRRILPKPGRVVRGSMTISPAGPGMVCLAYRAAQEDVPAAGIWSDTVAASAIHMRVWARQQPTPDVRLTFHGTTLAVNTMTLTATATGGQAGAGPAPTPPGPPLMDLPLFAYRRRPGGPL